MMLNMFIILILFFFLDKLSAADDQRSITSFGNLDCSPDLQNASSFDLQANNCYLIPDAYSVKVIYDPCPGWSIVTYDDDQCQHKTSLNLENPGNCFYQDDGEKFSAINVLCSTDPPNPSFTPPTTTLLLPEDQASSPSSTSLPLVATLSSSSQSVSSTLSSSSSQSSLSSTVTSTSATSSSVSPATPSPSTASGHDASSLNTGAATDTNVVMGFSMLAAIAMIAAL